jgi:protein-glutamine gamma-glutamyltransferase
MTRHPAAKTFFDVALLGMLASGFLAVAGSGELDRVTVVVMTSALLLRVLAIIGLWRWELPPALVTTLGAAYLLFYPADLWWLSRSFVTATVHMICFLAAVKILTAKTPRDFLYVKIVAMLELLAAALLSSDAAFFAYLAMFLLCAIASMAAGEMLRPMGAAEVVSVQHARAIPGRLAWISITLLCGILGLTSVLFFAIPRSARAAFQRFVPQRYHLPGFSAEIALGQIGELKANSTAVMHVQSYDGERLDGLRWRGSALTRFDGSRWYNPPSREERLMVRDGQLEFPAQRPTRVGHSLRYAVELSEIAADTLYFAGTPETVRIPVQNIFRSSSGALRVPRFGIAGLRYGAYSRIENEHAPMLEAPTDLSSAEKRALLELPTLDPRVSSLAASWASAATDAEGRARVLESHFHADFRYSLQMLDHEEADPLAHFLFVRRAGHCEYFASSVAVMLRTLGIPSRVATGFYGGVYNSLSGWQVIRAQDAHSWVEAWLPGRGWTTFDPTPPDPTPPRVTLWSRALLWMDAADQFWRDWVLTYDQGHQQLLAGRVQSAGRRWRAIQWPDVGEVGATLAAHRIEGLLVFVAVGGVPFFWAYRGAIAAWWHRRRRLQAVAEGMAAPADATLLYERMLALLRARGFEKAATQSVREFAAAMPRTDVGRLTEDLTDAYQRLRFGGEREAALRMTRLLRSLEQLP